MKLIFVNRYFYPDVSATSQILTDAAQYLSVDHEVHVVTSRLQYEGGAPYRNHEVRQGVVVHRLWSTSFGRNNLPGRAIDYLSFYLSVVFKLVLLAKADDVLIAKTDPPMLSVPVSWVARLKQARLINWHQDLFPEVAQALGVQAANWFSRPLLALRNSSLRRAKMNIAIGERMRNRIEAQGIESDRVVVVPNWSDGELITPLGKRSALRSEWSLDEVFVVGYSGNFGRAHDFDTLADCIEGLQDNKDIVFLFIGSGFYFDELKARRYSNCIFKPYQPRDRLSATLPLPDIHLISLHPNLEGLIVPSKIYGILAAGRGVINIGDPAGEIGEMASSHGIGVSVSPGNVNGLRQAILELKFSPERRARMGLAARALYDQRYNKQRSLQLLEAALCGSN